MSFSKRYDWRLGAVLAGMFATAASCADQQEALIISGAVPLSTDDTGACVPGEAGTGTGLVQGVLDVSFGTSYLLGVVLVNQLTAEEGANAGVDTSEMQIQDADISLSIPQAPEIIEAIAATDESLVSFTLPLATDSLPAASSKTITMEVVPAETSEALAAEMMAQLEPGQTVTLMVDIVVEAERSGNTAGNIGVVESRDYRFPISLCAGCLIDCSTCPMGQCPVEATNYAGGACGNAQDFSLVPSGCEQMQ